MKAAPLFLAAGAAYLAGLPAVAVALAGCGGVVALEAVVRAVVKPGYGREG